MTDLFGLVGTNCWTGSGCPSPTAARIASLRRIIAALDFEIDAFAGQVRARPARHPGFVAVQAIPASARSSGPKHHESDKHVHRGKITEHGSRLVRWPRASPCRPLRGRATPAP